MALHFGDTFSVSGPLQNADVCPLNCWCGASGAERSQTAIFRELADPTALFKENFSDDSSRGESGNINSVFNSAIGMETGSIQTTCIQNPFGSEITESADADGGYHWPSVEELLSSVSLFSTNLTTPTQEADETRLGNLRETCVSDYSHLTNATGEIQEGENLSGLSDVGETENMMDLGRADSFSNNSEMMEFSETSTIHDTVAQRPNGSQVEHQDNKNSRKRKLSELHGHSSLIEKRKSTTKLYQDKATSSRTSVADLMGISEATDFSPLADSSKPMEKQKPISTSTVSVRTLESSMANSPVLSARRSTASETKFGKASTWGSLLSITHLSESAALPEPASFKSIENSNTCSTIVSSQSWRTKNFRRIQGSALDSTSEFDLRGSEDTTFESTATKSTLIQDPTDCSMEVADETTSTDESSIGESRPRSDSEPVNGNPAKDLTNICETDSTLAKTNEGHQWPADGADSNDSSSEVNASNAGAVMTTDESISDFTDDSWISQLESSLNRTTANEPISELTDESVISQETLAGPSLIEASASVCCDFWSSHLHETGFGLHGLAAATQTSLSNSKLSSVDVPAPAATPNTIEFPRSVLKNFIDVSNSAHFATDSKVSGENPDPVQYDGQEFQCQRTFMDLAYRHERSHAGTKPFKCGQCEKSFDSPSNLTNHQRIHTGEKPFKCGQCEWTFAEPSMLRRHERTHTGEKPFKCGQCEKSFVQSSDLNVHERTHTGEKPFKCGQCEKSFSQSSNMKIHKATHSHRLMQ